MSYSALEQLLHDIEVAGVSRNARCSADNG
jgi:hypothetical protein